MKCPFCQSNVVETKQVINGFQTVCNSCYAKGSVMESTEDSELIWSRASGLIDKAIAFEASEKSQIIYIEESASYLLKVIEEIKKVSRS